MKVETVKDLIEYLAENCNPEDQLVFEDVDDDGDVIDLYPLTIDIIDIENEGTLNEVRMCRGNQKDWI